LHHIDVGLQAFAPRALATEREHVVGDVAAVDVETGAEVGDQQSSRAARGVESGFAVAFDEPLEGSDLGPGDVELRPVARDDSGVPRSRLGIHRILTAGAAPDVPHRPTAEPTLSIAPSLRVARAE
jgi:hypothetical protein